MTYLEVVNKVLRRLRENEVTIVNESPYSKLIGDLVNVVKREIEDSWNWEALRGTLTITTSDGLFNYVLNGATTRMRLLDVINDTTNIVMHGQTSKWFDVQFLIASTNRGAPFFYNFNGVSLDGDPQLDIYPIPNGTYLLRVNAVFPQKELSADADVVQINPQLLIEGVLARAISERGDDGGYLEQETRYNKMLSDLIAIEAAVRADEITWGAC